MKIVEESKKVVTIKEVDVTTELMELETGEILDLTKIVLDNFDSGDIVKVVITRQVKEEE